MSTMSIADAKSGFASQVDEAAGGEFVTITRHGKPAAAHPRRGRKHGHGRRDLAPSAQSLGRIPRSRDGLIFFSRG